MSSKMLVRFCSSGSECLLRSHIHILTPALRFGFDLHISLEHLDAVVGVLVEDIR